MLDKVFNPNEVDTKWQAAWREAGAFIADADSPNPTFTIVLPPPNITGSLTVGHALGTTVQDVLCRWKRLMGHTVLWLAGMDHAGIATQKVVERSLLERGITKDTLGREKFLEECWKWKDRYHDHIVRQLDRLGASLDWSRETFTLDPGVSRAVREVFVRLYERGLIYRERYIVNWCPSCLTALSDEEVEMRETRGKLYYIAYPFTDGGGEVVVGTTRPETMLGDVAVAMSPADERAGSLAGMSLVLPLTERTIPIILDDAVDPSFGTGCLKVTPGHDATDFAIGLRHELDPVVVIDRDGKMNAQAGRFAGLDRKDARRAVLDALESEGLLRKVEDYGHAIGHHDRCGTAIEPYISRQWFLRMKPLAEPGIAVAERGEVVFTPERWRNSYLSWMENIRDWCISRQLWWGHRIPVWYCADCDEVIAAVEAPERCVKCGGVKLSQDEDVLDTWFSSWLWTFSPMGWPERTKDLERFHPTDVLVTGGDIIFFWVARMIMASLAFMGEKPFSTVYITGIVRDARGRKMSKSLGNSPDPIDIMEKCGADAFRFSLIMLSPPGQDMLFDESKVDVGRHFANKIWNAARFILGQGIDPTAQGAADSGGTGVPDSGHDESVDEVSSLYSALFGGAPAGDASLGWEERWILSRLARRSREYEAAIDAYRFDEAARTIYDFFWHEYCDWYLELSKAVFREGGPRARGAAITARSVLGASMALVSPIMPFIAEEIWSMLAPGGGMLATRFFPGVSDRFANADLDEAVELFKEIVSTIRNLRQSFNIAPGTPVPVVISCERGRDLVRRLERFREPIRALARTAELEIGDSVSKPPGSAAAGLTGLEIYVPLAGIVDIEVERRRLSRELEKVSRDSGTISSRLADARFIEKAPAEVVEQERRRLDDMTDRKKRLERILEDLG